MKKYNTLNGLRTIACIGIVLMHILTNLKYTLNNNIITSIVLESNHFVFLFMIISAFSMCCGYYDKIKNNAITIEKFYKRRIEKIIPLFFFLIIIDILKERNVSSLIEGFANVTLMFGFLNKKIEVLGVAWFLGIIFIFYFLFPFFIFLISNKKRAWFVAITAILMNFSSIYYFNVGKTNFFYSFIYFVIGGLLFIYKDYINSFFRQKKFLNTTLILISLITYIALPTKGIIITIKLILLYTSIMIYAISSQSKILDNTITKFIGNISLEIYLSHMFIFRIAESLGILNLFKNNYISYIINCIIVLIGTIIFSKSFQVLWDKFIKYTFVQYTNKNRKGE